MAQAPVMPVYPDALIGDTMHLSAEEFGAYLLLLFATWRNNGNPLPDDPRKLARICRCPVARWNRILRPALIGFFRRDDNGLLHQKRLEKEWQICEKYRAKQFQNGSQGGRPRKSDNPLETPESPEPNGSVWPNPNETNPNPVGKEEDLAPIELNLSSFPTARDATPPPLPSRGDGDDAALRAPMPEAEPAAPTVYDDPALKADAIAMLGDCLDAVRGKLGTLEADATVPPPDPRIVAFRSRLQRLNTLAGRMLDGNVRLQAWELLSEAEARGPDAMPAEMVASLAAIVALDAYAEAAE